MSRLHQYSTGSTAQKTLAQATKGKVSDMEERWLWEKEEEDKPLLYFPSLKSLYYYWLLIILFNHFKHWPIKHKSLVRLMHMSYSTWYSTLCLIPVISHTRMIYLTYHILPSTVAWYPYRNGTATPCVSCMVRAIAMPPVVMISHLMWLAITRL
jgi:hypothetical protein